MLNFDEMDRECMLELINELVGEVAIITHKIDMIQSALHSEVLGETSVEPKEVIKMVAEMCDLNYCQVVGISRISDVVEARFLGMYLLRHNCGYSLEAVAKIFRRKSHGAVMNAMTQVDGRVETDKKFRKKFNEVLRCFDERFETEDEDETK